MRVDAGADCRSTQWKFSKSVAQFLKPPDAKLNLTRIASKFLAETYRCCILQMGSSDLDDGLKFLCFCRQGSLEFAQSGD